MLIPNLLVTDDDSAFREVVCEGLTRRGFHVTQANDGIEAIEVIKRAEVHICLLDFHMPRLSGLDVIRQVQAEGRRPPFVLMSADLTEEIRQEAEGMRVYGVLSKPIRLQHLSDVVCGALSDVYGWKPEVR